LVDDTALGEYLKKTFDMRPKAIIETLDLLRPIYRATAAYGHFGRKEFPWEDTTPSQKLADDFGRPAKVSKKK
jgi:S-adenosylmethionine synthetase